MNWWVDYEPSPFQILLLVAVFSTCLSSSWPVWPSLTTSVEPCVEPSRVPTSLQRSFVHSWAVLLHQDQVIPRLPDHPIITHTTINKMRVFQDVQICIWGLLDFCLEDRFIENKSYHECFWCFMIVIIKFYTFYMPLRDVLFDDATTSATSKYQHKTQRKP